MTSTLFGHDPWWLVGAKVLAVFVFLMLTVLVAILAERKLLGRMQLRPGPNRAGPKGALQSLADGIKLLTKEDLMPKDADGLLFKLAPYLAFAPAFAADPADQALVQHQFNGRRHRGVIAT